MKNKVLNCIGSCFLMCSAFVMSGAETLIDVDFSRSNVRKKIELKGIFKGRLPVGVCDDFPRWNTSIVSSEEIIENGQKFLRFNVKKLDSAVLFRISSKRIKVPGYYKLEVISCSHNAPLNMHIRQRKRPFRNFWSEYLEEGKGWKKQIFHIFLKNQKVKTFSKKRLETSWIVLYMSLKKGSTDIKSIKLSQIDQKCYLNAKSAEIKRPAKGTANYFNNSRFPLGMQSGWSINRENLLGTVEADSTVPGLSTTPSLKINSPEHIVVYSAPFQISEPNKKVYLSFMYKTKYKWRVKCGKTTGSLSKSDKWKKFTMDFMPDPTARAFNLMFIGKGTLHIDSLMACDDENIGYRSAGECEIALAPVKSVISSTRVQFIDEPAKVKFCATGKLTGVTLKGNVINVYNQKRRLRDIKLGQAKKNLESGELSFNLFPEAPLGPFRIEVWAERNGKRVSPYNEIIINRVRRPIYWGRDAPNSPFGGHYFSNSRVLATMKAGGMNWIRFNDACNEGTCWGWIEPEKGKWIFADDKISNYRKAKIKILGYLGSAPTWASYYSGKKHRYDYFNKMYQPKNITAFKNYVLTIVNRYMGVIDEYQFQNEPWGKLFWHKDYDSKSGEFDQGKSPAKDYVGLSKMCYAELKKIHPEAVMYGFNSGHGRGGRKWTQKVFDDGAYPYCDIIDYHYYNLNSKLNCFPGDSVTKAYNDAVGYIKKHVKPPMKPVVMSEGCPIRSGSVQKSRQHKSSLTGLMKYTMPWKQDKNSIKNADITCRFVISHLALKVKRVFLYSDHCYHNMLRSPTFPVLLGTDGYPYPTLVAFSNMAWLLEDRPFVKHFQVGKKVWAYIFTGRGKSVAVISGFRNGVYTIPKNDKLKVLDLFGNPIKGKVVYKGQLLYVVSKLSSKELRLILKSAK